MKLKKTSTSLLALTLTGSLATLAIGCGKKESASSLDPALSHSLEAGVTSVSGVADDVSGGSFAKLTTESKSATAWALITSVVPDARASGQCTRALNQTCNSGVKTISYSDCSIANSAFTMTGTSTLTYSDTSCALDVNDNVTRTYDFTVTGPRGGQVQVTSDLHQNYQGTQLQGGGKLTRTSSSQWSLDILGQHAIARKGDETIYDVSVHTTSPVTMTGSVLRGGRTMDGGAIEVDHNVRGFSAVYEPSKLHWSMGCCHPVSGSMKVTYSGSITGSGTVTFKGCGQASIEKEGVSEDVGLTYCE